MGIPEAILRYYDRVAKHAKPQRPSMTCMTAKPRLRLISDVTEIDEIVVVGVATPHGLFKIILPS